QEKLSTTLACIYDEAGWTLGDFLYTVFAFGDNIHRDQRHSAVVSSFLQGRSGKTPVQILDLWSRHPDG
ncbi:hypothetical protein GY45DRAFT_1232568, partial [Cubamyces sp. BRFM 1775]